MSRILFAWELGANFGHLARDLPVAARLRDLGHDVLFAVRDIRVAEQVLSPNGFRFLQAPGGPQDARRRPPSANYSEMLLGEGYADARWMQASINVWTALFSLQQTELVVFNHAPTALLAARVSDIPVVITGNGFEVPPCSDPLPTIRPWENLPAERLRQADTHLLSTINKILGHHGKPSLRRISDLFAGVPTLLTTFPELDHYGARNGVKYVGPLSALPSTTEQAWTSGGGSRVFAYLRPSAPGFEQILAALQEADASVICVAPGISHEMKARFASPSFTIATAPVPVTSVLQQADLAVVSGAGTMADALMAGVPLLMVPEVVEQALAAQRVELLGAGVLWRPPRTLESARAMLRTTLSNASLKFEAQRLAERHGEYAHEGAVQSVVDTIVRAAGCGMRARKQRT